MDFFRVKKLDNNMHFVNNEVITKDTYTNLHKEALKMDHSKFYNLVNNDFEFDNNKIIEFINELALSTQVVIKKSKLMFLHGYLLYVVLDKYIKNNQDIKFFNILETGTARGFSAICMAKALYDNNKDGKIYTIDIIPNNIKMYWNCIKDFENEYTRIELLKDYNYLLKYIEFITGDTINILKSINLPRINFAFLDAQHDYIHLNNELNFTKQKQEKNDIIICDDYTIYNDGRLQYPGINKAIDEFNEYSKKIYYGNDTEKLRGYVYLKKL
tara:strand:+ start:5149 stop:5961 length:813 start_codon:yes stop_codon:yes gene_type:complete